MATTSESGPQTTAQKIRHTPVWLEISKLELKNVAPEGQYYRLWNGLKAAREDFGGSKEVYKRVEQGEEFVLKFFSPLLEPCIVNTLFSKATRWPKEKPAGNAQNRHADG
jgi:hypothetical protein